MSYTIEKIEADKALEDFADYQYALIYMMSEIIFCKTADLDAPDWGECLEARFFDENKELHIYEEDGKLRAVKIDGSVDSDCLTKKYKIRSCYFGQTEKERKYLCVCEHLDYDEDGQAFVILTRLTGIE